MPQKLKIKDYRRIVSFISDISFLRNITKKQHSLLTKQRGKTFKGKLKNQKLSNFGQKLQSKRLFSILYGNISKKQYSLLFQEALKYPGKIGINFLSLVEKRLDVVVYRMFLFKTLNSARQYISHKRILVNEKIVNFSNYRLKMGDVIQIRNSTEFFSQTFTSNHFLSNVLDNNKDTLFIKFPHYEVNYKILTGIFLFSPQQVYYPLNIKLTDLIS